MTEIAEIDAVIADLAEQKRSLAVGLQPYWNGKEDLKHGIMATFGRTSRGGIRFSFERSAQRRAIYNDMLELALEYGDLAEQYRDVCADIEANVRNRKRLMLMEERSLHRTKNAPVSD